MSSPGTPPTPPARRSDLKLRLASAFVMLAIAAVAVIAGGTVFAAFAALGAGLVMLEWSRMSGPFRSRAAAPGSMILVAVTVFAAKNDPALSLAALAAVSAVLVLFAAIDRPAGWLGLGVLYAGVPGVAAVVLRGAAPAGEVSAGLVAVMFVFLVVIATDSGAYFAGRSIGGPKLWARVSPKKTWSGAIGGLLCAILIGLLVARMAATGALAPVAVVAAALSIVSQGGDLLESAMKRHFGVKDSGTIIPGHGGIMDRVDGLVVALVLAAAIGLVRSGGTNAGEGLLYW